MIRFTVTSSHTTMADIERDWQVITDTAAIVMALGPVELGLTMAGDDQLEDSVPSSASGTDNEEAEISDEDQVPMTADKETPVTKPLTRKMPLAGTFNVCHPFDQDVHPFMRDDLCRTVDPVWRS